jgi:S1-C subfamily serine protease
MRKTVLMIGALVVVVAAAPAHAGQQASPQQRREIEKRLDSLDRERRDLERQLGDGPRARTRIFGNVPEIMRIGPGGELYRMATDRAKFGFGFQTLADSGVKVTTVTPGSPAEKVGIRTGDVITMFNGLKLTGIENPDEELMRQARDLEVGDTVGVEFRRGNERKSGRMVARDLGPNPAFGALPDSFKRFETPRVGGDMPMVMELGAIPGRWMDIEMVSLNRELGEYFGTPEGVLVVRAPKDSSLALRSGDVILAIDGRRPVTPPQALRILRSYEQGESFEIVVLRQKKKMTVTAKVPQGDPRASFYEYKIPENERYKVQGNP